MAGRLILTVCLMRYLTKRGQFFSIHLPTRPDGQRPLKKYGAVLEFARARGIWIIADEVYSRFVYDADRAPSFYDIIDPDDRVMLVNTFSKNWAMTGWRAGWICAPQEIGQVIENLVQYSTSGVLVFTQRAVCSALRDGEEFFAMQKQRALASRDILCDGLLATGKVRLARPQGAFYLFF